MALEVLSPNPRITPIRCSVRQTIKFVILMVMAPALWAQPAPNCGDTCGGGIQPSGTGGGPIQTMTSASNQRGPGGARVTTQGTATSSNIEGSQSYTYGVPLFAIPGRGLDLNLTLYYNSLLWDYNGDNRSMVYAADFEFPGPGFTLGYGRIDFSTDFSLGFLVEPTGARRLLVPSTTANQYHTTDSTYITVQYPTAAGGPVIATFKDGVRCFYQPFTVLVNNHTEYRASQLEDTNGNLISISYANPNNLNISTITDTVGRVIRFTYDSTATMLQSVAELDAGGNVYRQYTFRWAQNQTLTFNFNLKATAGLGLTPGTLTSGQTTVNLLNKVIRPDNTAVSFDYVQDGTANGNPDWGIVKTITELSSAGLPRLTTSYLLPTASAGQLTSNPTYSQQTVNDTVNSKVWSYQATKNSSGMVTSFVTTDPCGNILTTTFSANGDALDGQPIQEQLTSPQTPVNVSAYAGCPKTNAQTWRTISKAWTTDSDGSNPRLKTLTTVLEDGKTESQVSFNTYDSFGQVTDQLEYDFGASTPGALMRETVTTYASPGSGIVNRPSRIVVKDGAGNTVARTDFNYDEYSSVPIQDISPNPTGHDPAFTSSFTGRGNLTSVIGYANAAGASGAFTSKYTYDAAGNRLTSQNGCCTFSELNFSANTDYAYPDSVVNGPVGNPLTLTTSFTYNFLTGTRAMVTDANGQVTKYSYDLDDRLLKTTLPDNSTISQSYDDSSASPSVSTSNSFNSLVTVATVAGPTTTKQVENGTTLVSTSTATRDLLGRTVSVSNPYGPGDTPLYTVYQYDTLDRVTQVAPPGNTGAYVTSYGIQAVNSADPFGPANRLARTLTATDPAGQQRRQYADSRGELLEVDEPGPSGGQPGVGSISITGTEQSVSVQNGGGATAGTASLTLSGTERSTVVLTHAATPASVTVTIGGSDTTDTNTACTTNCTRTGCTTKCFTTSVKDGGTLSFTITAAGTTIGPVSTTYNGSSTPVTLAAGLYQNFPANSAVTMSNPNGNATFTLTSTALASAANNDTISTSLASSCVDSDTMSCGGVGWAMTLSGPNLSPTNASSANFTGGSDNVNTTMYDTGTVTVATTINGTQYSKTSNYGQNSSISSIGTDLANQINADTTLNQLLIASFAGSVLNLTTKATGNGTNYPLSASSATNSQYFSSGSTSFPASPSGSNFTPGQNGTIYDTGLVHVILTGFISQGYSKSVSYSQGSTPTSVASSIAGAFNSDPLSPVSAIASGGTVTLTATTAGADTNYGVTVSGATSQTSYFTQASFSGSGVALSGGQDPTASLATPLSTYYSYDGLGDLLQISQGQQTRTYTYDNLRRVLSAKVPETQGIATAYSYTDQGVYQRTDPRGIVTTYGYDALGRVNQLSYNDGTPTVNYTFGGAGASNFGAGRLIRIVDASGTTTVQFDLMGRTTQVSRVVGGQTYTTSYGYANEQLSQITYPSGRTVTVVPDAIGRLSMIGSNGSSLLNVNSYNAAGKILGLAYGNGMNASYTYNSQLQLASLVSGSSTTPVLNLTYNYGAQNNGQILGITDGINSPQSTTYTYDELGRLKTAQTNDLSSANTWKLRFKYDRYGNRLAELPLAGTASMPFSDISVDPTTNRISGLQYDSAGNATNDGLHTYSYDAENRLKQVDGAGSYVYDAGGHRVIKNGVVYIYEGGQVAAEYTSGAAPASPSREYVGRLASFANSATTYYYSDQLSIRALADASGSVIGRQTQYPFGEMVSGIQTGTATKWQFTSYEGDRGAGDSGLDYAQARFYTNRFGRFTSLDPLSGGTGSPQSLNRYAYSGNDPINAIDPSGMLHGRLTCLLDQWGNCVGGNGYSWGEGGWGDAQLLMNDSMSIFSDPFGPWSDPTRGDPLAEGEARYEEMVAASFVAASSGEWEMGGDRPCTDEESDGADVCVHADSPQAPVDSSISTPTISFGDCVRKGTSYFNLSNALAGMTGGAVGNGPISDAFLGNPVTGLIDLLQGDPSDAIGHGIGHGSGDLAEILAPLVPNLYPLGRGSVPIVPYDGAVPTGWMYELEIPLKAMAKTGAGTFNTALKGVNRVKLPFDLAVGAFSAFICAMNY